MFFPDDRPVDADGAGFPAAVAAAARRYAQCAAHIRIKYFSEGGRPVFNHMNTDQYAMFLYFLANGLYRAGDEAGAEKFYALNKALHALDVFYAVELPDIFLFSHAVGTVLGRGRFDNYFAVYQNCTVGDSSGEYPPAGLYPSFGEGVVLYKGAMVCGDCRIGRNVHVSAHSLIRNETVADDSIIYGQTPSLTVKKAHMDVKAALFGHGAGRG